MNLFGHKRSFLRIDHFAIVCNKNPATLIAHPFSESPRLSSEKPSDIVAMIEEGSGEADDLEEEDRAAKILVVLEDLNA